MPKSLAELRVTAYKIPTGSKEIKLSCGHTAWYQRPYPKPNEPAYCRTHGEWTTPE